MVRSFTPEIEIEITYRNNDNSDKTPELAEYLNLRYERNCPTMSKICIRSEMRAMTSKSRKSRLSYGYGIRFLWKSKHETKKKFRNLIPLAYTMFHRVK